MYWKQFDTSDLVCCNKCHTWQNIPNACDIVEDYLEFVCSECEEETCCKCGNDDETEVEQCNGCDRYICIKCDQGEMGTYSGDDHTYCYDCFPEEEED